MIFFRLSSLIAFLALSSACGRIERTRECRRFARLVNQRLDSIEAQVKPRSADAYRAASRGYAALAAELRVSAKAVRAEVSAEEFAQVFDSAANATQSYADAMDAKDKHRTEESRRELERLSRHQQGIVQRVTLHCEGP
ncbi:MAG: hypothetical protein ACOY0T_11760 [Myxococcota bacterium]